MRARFSHRAQSAAPIDISAIRRSFYFPIGRNPASQSTFPPTSGARLISPSAEIRRTGRRFPRRPTRARFPPRLKSTIQLAFPSPAEARLDFPAAAIRRLGRHFPRHPTRASFSPAAAIRLSVGISFARRGAIDFPTGCNPTFLSTFLKTRLRLADCTTPPRKPLRMGAGFRPRGFRGGIRTIRQKRIKSKSPLSELVVPKSSFWWAAKSSGG